MADSTPLFPRSPKRLKFATLQKDRVYCAVAVGFTVACVLATIPVLEMGWNDDWSYSFIVRGLAQSGELRYHGWVNAMIGVQAYWAALLIRMFGFSFTLVRLSTLPFATGCAAMIYGMGRFVKLSPSLSLFATLAITLSPVFTPLAASFMTDIPALFFWLACIYLGLLAARASLTVPACCWLAGAALCGVAGGTVRQAVWAVPMLVIPCVGWACRENRYVVAFATACWSLSALSIAFFAHWIQAQPYVQLEGYSVGLDEAISGRALLVVVWLLVCCLTFLLPILMIHVPAVLREFRFRWTLLVGTLFVGGLFELLSRLMPGAFLLGNIVTVAGVLAPGQSALGEPPFLLTGHVLFWIKFAVFASASATVALLLESTLSESPFRESTFRKGFFRRRTALAHQDAPLPPTAVAGKNPFRLFLLFYVPSALVYIAAIVYHRLDNGPLFDRYALELLPLLGIALLKQYQSRVRQTVGTLAWAAPAIFAIYGILTTHDSFAADRARLQAASVVAASGVPRTHIEAGLAYDGWTEVETSGYIYTPDIQNPPGARMPASDHHYPVSPGFWFWDFAPSIEPGYFVVNSHVPGLRDSVFPAIPYTAWLPPFHRQVLTQVADENR